MYSIYSLLLTIGFLVLLPRFAIDALRTRKYVTGLRQRLGSIPNLAASDRRVIWLHCVSVGETEAARPLVRALRERFPSHRLVVSTTTVTGQKVARNAFAQDATAIFYFPIDWVWTVRRVLRAINPSVVLIMETELWPNLLRECRRRSIPVALINGRISQKSYRRYQRIGTFMQRVLRDLPHALMQSDDDAARISALGLSKDRISIFGNLKFDSSVSTKLALTQEIERRFALSPTDPLVIAASTHSPEESIILEAFKTIKASAPGQRARLLIAPRHPERFAEVARLIADSGMSWTRRSELATDPDETCNVILFDSIGELRAVFPLADIAFIGGSIVSHGGQNVLEPAAQGVCVITGAHTHNFAAITKALLAEDALIQLPDVSFSDAAAELASSIIQLLADDDRRQAVGARALAVCDRSRGATQRTVDKIANLLDSAATTTEGVPLSAIHVTAAK